MHLDYASLYGDFLEYAPAHFEGGYSLKRWQGIDADCRLHSLDAALDGGYGSLDRDLVLFDIDGKRISVFNAYDFYKLREDGNGNAHFIEPSNLAGIVAERIAWVTTRKWLAKYLPGELITTEYPEGHIYRHSENFILKVSFSPRLVMLEQRGNRPGSYDVLTDIDGLFVYEHGDQRYLIVQEAKTEGLSLGLEDKAYSLFNPLKELFPGHRIIYVVYSDMESIYLGGNALDMRRKNSNHLKDEPIRIFNYLADMDIATLFFGFRGFNKSLGSILQHLEIQQKLINREKVIVPAVIEGNTVTLLGGDSPFAIFKRKRDNLWEHYLPKKKKK
jgi:hypothetical protein